MDQVAPAAYNPHVQRVLKSFQSAAEASLSGPSRYMDVWPHLDPSSTDSAKAAQEISLQEFRKAMLSTTLCKKSPTTTLVDKQSVGANDSSPTGTYFPSSGPFSVSVPHMGPVFLPMDRSHSEKSETSLEGHPISCFIVGGEKRLCLPQILNTVLQDFTLQQINTICDDLHIFCSRCNRQQLELLKMTGVLPPNAPSCGLITKTDAERLCNALLHGSPEKSREPPSPNSFKVYHECFGKCKGVFTPELYSSPNAKCIDCCDCHGMFSPQKFVCHSHKALENRTCHWGFDSENWRAYILLAKDQDSRENMQKALHDMKDKYVYDISGYKKRRESPNHRSKESESKRARFEENGKIYDGSNSPWVTGDFPRSLSAFRPWSPGLVNLIKEGKIPAPNATRESLSQLLPSFLQTGPPVLLNPERVVPFNDTKRYDRHFAPNVSLAPQAKDDEKPEFESPQKVDPKLLSSTSSYSLSSSSTSALSSPSPIKVERNPEYEFSSSDESSFRSESVPTTPREDMRHLVEVAVPGESDLLFDRDVMAGLVKRALESVPEKFDDHENILDQMMEIWGRQEDRIRALVQSRKHLIQEMELLRVSKRERLQEMSESRLLLRQEVERLKSELDSRSREASTEQKRLRQEIDILKASKQTDLARVKGKYKGQIECLMGRLEQYEKQNSCLVTEMTMLRQQLKGLGEDVADFSNSHKVLPKSREFVNGDAKDEVMEWEDKAPPGDAYRTTRDAEKIKNGHRANHSITIIADEADEETETDVNSITDPSRRQSDT